MTNHSSRPLSTNPSMNFPIFFFPQRRQMDSKILMKCEVNHLHMLQLQHLASPLIQRESQKILIRDMLIWSYLWKLNICDHLNNHFLCFPTREEWTIVVFLLLQVHQKIITVHLEIRMQCTENAYIPFLYLQIIWRKYTKALLAVCCFNPHFLRNSNQEKI